MLKKVAAVFSGSLLAQVLSLVSVPVVTRVFLPAEYGLFTNISMLSAVIGVAVTLQFSQAMLLPKSEKNAVALLILSLASTFLLACCMCIVIAVFGSQLALALGLPEENAALLAWVPLQVLLIGLFQSFQSVLYRRERFKVTAAAQVVRAVVTGAIQIGLGYIHAAAWVLLLSISLAEAFAIAVLLRFIDLRTIHNKASEITRHRLAALCSKYKSFAMYGAPQEWLNASSQGVPLVLITYYYGAAEAGFFALAVRILQVPVQLIGNSVRPVLLQHFAVCNRNGIPIFGNLVKGSLALAIISAFPVGVLMLWSVPLFESIFGTPWRNSGIFAVYLSIWTATLLFNIPALTMT